MRLSKPLRAAAIVAGLSIAAAGCNAAPAASGSPAASTAASAPSGPGGSASAGPIVWPAPPDPMGLAVKAGLTPQPKEFLENHVHAHLDVFVDGRPVAVPAGIGIKIDDPAVQVDDLPDGTKRYGGIELCNEPCISPLHTHGVDGILHTESASSVPNTLGEFFIEWGVAFDESCVATFCAPATPVAIYLDGKLATGDPRAIQLTDHLEIAVVIGTPPAVIPSTADFSNA
jgi:hypothetical protein